MKARFSANLGFLWRDLPLSSRIHRAMGCGFDAIEFHDEPVMDTHRMELLETLQSANLPVISINTPMGQTYGSAALNSLYSTNVNNLIWETIKIAKEIGSKAIHVTSGISADDHVPEHYYGALQYVLEHFDGDVYIEPISHKVIPHYYMHSVDLAASICEHFNHDRLKILFDFLHVRHDHENVLESFKKYLHLIGHIQISSFPSRHEPDTGLLDYQAILPLAFQMGYQNYIGIEYNPTTTVEDGLSWMDDFRSLLG